jgi:predicted RNase H-like HicB family nuclease
VATGATLGEIEQQIKEAIAFAGGGAIAKITIK